MQVGHGKLGIQVNRHLILFHRGGDLARVFAAQRQQVVRLGIQLVIGQHRSAQLLGLPHAPAVGENGGVQQLHVGILSLVAGQGLEQPEGLVEALLQNKLTRGAQAT